MKVKFDPRFFVAIDTGTGELVPMGAGRGRSHAERARIEQLAQQRVRDTGREVVVAALVPVCAFGPTDRAKNSQGWEPAPLTLDNCATLGTCRPAPGPPAVEDGRAAIDLPGAGRGSPNGADPEDGGDPGDRPAAEPQDDPGANDATDTPRPVQPAG